MRRTLILAFLGFSLGFVSCKKEDPDFEPVKVPSAEEVMVGRWNLVFIQAEGNAKVAGNDVPVTGSNADSPEGYYDVRTGEKENTYSYDIKTKLILLIGGKGGATREYNYSDKDAGTWVLKSEESLTFYANQGNVEDVFFTMYDSAEVQHMQITVPIDTVLSGIDYNGKFILDMIKEE